METALTIDKIFTLEEVSKHIRSDSMWIIINNSVYDITTFIKSHPGGKAPLYQYVGKDGTLAFNRIKKHGKNKVIKKLESLYIGKIKQ